MLLSWLRAGVVRTFPGAHGVDGGDQAPGAAPGHWVMGSTLKECALGRRDFVGGGSQAVTGKVDSCACLCLSLSASQLPQ